MSLATLQLRFDAGADSNLLALAYLDETMNVDADGNVQTQFLPSDTPYFLVHLDPLLVVNSIVCSSGTVRSLGLVMRSAQADLDVATDEDTQELEYIPAVDPAFFWYGNTPAVTRQERSLQFSGDLPAAGRVSYQYRALSYQYVPPSLGPTQDWRTLIVVHVGGLT